MTGSRATFPATRLRRLRRTPWSRGTLRETHVHASQLILPVFVDPTVKGPVPISSLPGHFRWPPGSVLELAFRAERAGLGGLILFGRSMKKTVDGKNAWDPESAVPRALRVLKGKVSLSLVTDVCLCAYTTSGHCGYYRNGEVENDRTLDALSRIAVTYAKAGADWVAPSAMMDGQVQALRKALDEKGFSSTAILSYAMKSVSSLYDPFREAEDSSPSEGDRRGYQMDFSNLREALHEMEMDAEEGADILMIKPGLTNLDILSKAKERFLLPLAVYSVSGEYAMIKAGAEKGALSEERFVPELLTAFRRAGANVIITYHALEAAESRWI